MIHTYAYADKKAGVCTCGKYFQFHGEHPALLLSQHIRDITRQARYAPPPPPPSVESDTRRKWF